MGEYPHRKNSDRLKVSAFLQAEPLHEGLVERLLWLKGGICAQEWR